MTPTNRGFGAIGLLVIAAAGGYVVTRTVMRSRAEGPNEPIRTGSIPIDEVSGLAIGQGDVLWVHNDSGADSTLYAIDSAGNLLATFDVGGSSSHDWEDISRGPCSRGRRQGCLYIADIGDNARRRSYVSIYRLPEPEPSGGDATVQADRMDLVYPDGPVNAEAIFVDRAGIVHLLTKEEGQTRHMRASFAPGNSTWQYVETIPLSPGELVTGADYDPDNRRVLVRTYDRVLEFDFRQNRFTGRSRELPVQDERQGETIAYSHRRRRFWHVSEGQGAAIWSEPIPRW